MHTSQTFVICLFLAAAVFLQPASAGVDNWTLVANLSFARSDLTADTVNGMIYLTGGCNAMQLCNFTADECSCLSITNNTVMFNPITYTFTPLPDMPIPRYRHASCVWGDSIYYFGGRTIPADDIIYQVDMLNTTTLTWHTQETQAPPYLGSDNACFVLGDVIYLMGGYNADYSVSMNITYKYYPATDSWGFDAAQMLHGRGDFAAIAVNGIGYVYGGYQASDFCEPINYAEEYDPQLDVWVPRDGMSDDTAEKKDGVILNGLIFSVGGEKKDLLVNCNDWNIISVRDVYSYNITLNQWQNQTFLPGDRFRLGAAVADQKLFVFGGQGSLVNDSTTGLVYFPVLNEVWEFNFAATQQNAPTNPPSTGLSSGAIAGIVIGTLFGVFLAFVAVIVFLRRFKSPSTGGSRLE